MKVLVTGSSGHLGEALVRTLREKNAYEIVSIDCLPSEFTSHVGSITNREFVKECMKGVKTVFHLATLHKPHVSTHSRQDFIDTNLTGTLNLLEEAHSAGVEAFIYTSTTSTFGDALVPPVGAPAAWITEEVTPAPKNIYGVTKVAAEDFCQLFSRNHRLNCVILRTSRFFREEDDDPATSANYSAENCKANEFLYRRVDIADIVSAVLLAAEKAKELKFRRYIISGTTPFSQADLVDLRNNAPEVVARYFPDFKEEYEKRNWKMFPSFDRLYINERARTELGWQPKYDFAYILSCLKENKSFRSSLGELVGEKGYHRTHEEC
jgi:UDP-glucose 4-epimerase